MGGWGGLEFQVGNSSVGTLGELQFSVFYLRVLSYIIFTLVYMRSYTNHIYKKHMYIQGQVSSTFFFFSKFERSSPRSGVA